MATLIHNQLSWDDGEAFVEISWTPTGLDPLGGFLRAGPLTQVRIVNTSLSHYVKAIVKRPNGQSWINQIFPPGTNQTVNPPFTGPVKNIQDIPWNSFGEIVP
jgi:hypothetical protein